MEPTVRDYMTSPKPWKLNFQCVFIESLKSAMRRNPGTHRNPFTIQEARQIFDESVNFCDEFIGKEHPK